MIIFIFTILNGKHLTSYVSRKQLESLDLDKKFLLKSVSFGI